MKPGVGVNAGRFAQRLLICELGRIGPVSLRRVPGRFAGQTHIANWPRRSSQLADVALPPGSGTYVLNRFEVEFGPLARGNLQFYMGTGAAVQAKQFAQRLQTCALRCFGQDILRVVPPPILEHRRVLQICCLVVATGHVWRSHRATAHVAICC